MKEPLHYVRQGLWLMAVVFLLSVLGYRVVGGYSWLEAVWMVVITFSTVGYSEHTEQPEKLQWLTIFVIVGGGSAFAYTSSVLVQAVLDGDFRRALGVRKMNRKIGELERHVVICGFGRLGQDLAGQLAQRNIPCLAIDRSEQFREQRADGPTIILHGDATSEELLLRAGIARARSIVCALPSDADNVFVALTARTLAPTIQIVARAEQASSCKKLRQAGADRIVMPHHSGALQMERMISRPTSADLMEIFSEQTHLRIELDEFAIDPGNRLVGKSLADCHADEYFGLIVVGLRNSADEMVFHPSAATVLSAGDHLIVMGSLPEITRFRQHYSL